MPKLTPMMEQYFDIKNQYKDCLLFFRLGDFYELFYDDALTASKELEITLTGKDCGQEERAPMCGVPFHSADSYITKLVSKGYKIAICEQMEDPREAKGIVKRDVIRVVTPGTVLDQTMLDAEKNNFIISIYGYKNAYGLCVCDVTTGEMITTEFTSYQSRQKLHDEMLRLMPAEIICNEEFKNTDETHQLEKYIDKKMQTCEKWTYDYSTAYKKLCSHFGVHNLDGFGLKDKRYCISASGSLLTYLEETQKNGLQHISTIRLYWTDCFMVLDSISRKNLELTETMREHAKRGSLLWVLDKTKTAMGARMLRRWVEQPLIDLTEINHRLESVAELKENILFREELKEILESVYDFERIMSKIVYKTANCRELLSLKYSLTRLPLLKEVLKKSQSAYLQVLMERLDPLEDIYALLQASIREDAPLTIREGGMISQGFQSDLDILFRSKEQGSQWIAEMEEREKIKTGIKNLKIRFNKVFGYYIEITKSYISLAPKEYIRKQTLANCERYTTEELNNLAELILGADEKIVKLEYDLFCEIRDGIAKEISRIQRCACVIAEVDCIQSLSETAQQQGYCCPEVTDDGVITIQSGRHPVSEKLVDVPFVPNDAYLDLDSNRLSIITGPNMAGKSTYMRQTALIVLLAQIGSFVPARFAHIGIVDRIFTRVGASDDLVSGQSTFMMEMTEVANILNNATQRSLLILDEIGRGTSTFDGLSIAWAVLEYIVDQKQIGAKTLFATHYHELTELEGKLQGIKNYCISVKEEGENIIFLRKIIQGGADHSYGVQVARLAGLPTKVIRRAQEILKQLNAADINKKTKRIANEAKEASEQVGDQMDIFHAEENRLADEIAKIDIMALSPIEALQILFDLQKKAKGL